jgi:hypothetical protein
LQQEQQQKDAAFQRTNSNASSVTPVKPTGGYTNYSLFNTPSPEARAAAASQASASLAPRQGYSFKRSESYDTAELLRKYGGMTGPPPSVPAPPPQSQSQDVRGQALRVLDLVDDQLKTPLDVRRTQSGGFRAAPALNYPYNVRRTTSGRILEEEEPYNVRRTTSGRIQEEEEEEPHSMARAVKRVPSALAGLSLNNSQQQQPRSVPLQGRMSYTDPRFRDDDEMSFEDEIVHKLSDESDDLVDVARMDLRGASSRSKDHFAGDFPNKTWSSRYSSSSNPMGKNNGVILDSFDRDHDRQRQSARNMFAASAYQVKNAVDNTTGRVFGSGFSFRQSHVFGSGSTTNDNAKPQVNLRTVWKDVDEDPTHPTTPKPVHKTWQTAMLNKRKRRRILVATCFALVACAIITYTSVNAANRNRTQPSSATKATAEGIGSSVTFYVTSDVPYDKGEETKLNKDLANISGDAEFIMHLGNIQDSSFMCPSTRYSDVASVLSKSPVPMFIIPGEEDWAKCPMPGKSLVHWLDAFLYFEDRFKHPFQVYRHEVSPEDFAYVHNGVLFFGLHLVNGLDQSEELQPSQDSMLKFYFGMLNNFKDQYRAVVLLGNARPSPAQQVFFTGVFTSLKIKVPVAYIHANSGTGNSVQQYTPFEDHEDIVGIEIQDGGKNPPLKITVGFGERPFLVG